MYHQYADEILAIFIAWTAAMLWAWVVSRFFWTNAADVWLILAGFVMAIGVTLLAGLTMCQQMPPSR